MQVLELELGGRLLERMATGVRSFLAQRVPFPVPPNGQKPPGIAARIAYHKTGVVTSLDKLTATHLSTLLGEVLNDATYRGNARRIQKAIVKANGLSAAADLVEESLGMTEAGRPHRFAANI
jgi:zeaxanthin glucosyltransferase